MNDSPSTILPEWPTRWPARSFGSPWTWVLAIPIAAVCVYVFVTSLKSGTVSLTTINPALLIFAIALQFAVELVLVAIVLTALPGLSQFSLRELGFRAPTLATIGIAVLGSLAMAVVANGSASLIDALAHSKHEQDVVEMFKGIHSHATIAFFVVYAVVLAPFAEETFFRVFFFNLGLRYGGFWGGAILSGALFGLVHGDVYAALPLALGGVVLCYVYYRTRNAYASMISHGLFNAFSLAALLFAPKLIS